MNNNKHCPSVRFKAFGCKSGWEVWWQVPYGPVWRKEAVAVQQGVSRAGEAGGGAGAEGARGGGARSSAGLACDSLGSEHRCDGGASVTSQGRRL